MEIINFGGVIPEILVVDPVYKIAGRGVKIVFFKTPQPQFRVSVACQSGTILSSNIDRMIREINLEPLKESSIPFIIPNESNPTKTPGGAYKLKEKSGDYYISTNLKAYPVDSYKIRNFPFKDRRRYFTENKSSWNNRDHPVNWAGGNSVYSLTPHDVLNLKNMLNIMKAYFVKEEKHEI